MNKSARSVLRRLGHDQHLDDERAEKIRREIEDGKPQSEQKTDPNSMESLPDEMLSESEKRHEKYRRQQAMAGRFTPAAERLPIMTQEERQERDKDRPKWSRTEFEGPLEKLIEKYQDLEEVKKHLTLGQSMKYEFTKDGKVLDQEGNLIYDGQQLVKKA